MWCLLKMWRSLPPQKHSRYHWSHLSPLLLQTFCILSHSFHPISHPTSRSLWWEDPWGLEFQGSAGWKQLSEFIGPPRELYSSNRVLTLVSVLLICSVSISTTYPVLISTLASLPQYCHLRGREEGLIKACFLPLKLLWFYEGLGNVFQEYTAVLTY